MITEKEKEEKTRMKIFNYLNNIVIPAYGSIEIVLQDFKVTDIIKTDRDRLV